MALNDPTQAAQDWANRLAGSTDKIKRGVESVRQAPGQAAAAQAQVWLANVQASQDKWRRNVGSVSLQDWQTATVDKGLSRIGPGAQAAQSKMAAVFTTLFPHIESVRKSLKPRGNLEQNIQRSADFARGMSQYRKQS